MSPDPNKVEAIKHAVPPTNKAELKSFLGMTNYSSCFIKNYSKKTEILRQLLKDDVKWNWNKLHRTCFDKLKNSLIAESILGYFAPNLRSKIIVDASPSGLGAILLQEQSSGNDQIIAYASRALSTAEKH